MYKKEYSRYATEGEGGTRQLCANWRCGFFTDSDSDYCSEECEYPKGRPACDSCGNPEGLIQTQLTRVAHPAHKHWEGKRTIICSECDWMLYQAFMFKLEKEIGQLKEPQTVIPSGGIY